MRDLLAIVPARGGSRGIVGKNLRPLAGRPLILHTLSTLRQVEEIARLVVSTDSEEIGSICRLHGYDVIQRPSKFATPEATLSEVAVAVAEASDWEGDIGVFQPTSPLRSAMSVVEAIAEFRRSECDSLASVVREDHLYWLDETGDVSDATPLFAERVNRQYGRHAVLRETGSIQLVTAEALLEQGSLVTRRHRLFETDRRESVDIDSLKDLHEARTEMERGTVVFRLHANQTVGLGHLHHCFVLAEELQHHDIMFLLRDCDVGVTELVSERGWKYEVESDIHDSLSRLKNDRPRILVNDVLDTTIEDVLPAKSLGFRVVNIEDLGEGARYADWVVNALYVSDESEIVSQGRTWATLRPEFLALPEKQINHVAKTVLVTFGGSDPAGLTKRFATELARTLDCEIRVVVGPSAEMPDLPSRVTVLRSIRSMAEEMLNADLVLTSAGRTVYEAAATGTPTVVIAQNAREATHSHLSFENGTVFMGIGTLVDEDHVVQVVRRLLDNVDLRREMSRRLRSMIDGQGAKRIARRIDAMIQELI